ncbi:MAG: hypothetical protein Tsb0013_13510 [Phycisphaerales bacterium]
MPEPIVEEARLPDPVLRVQREVSRARSEPELILNFVREIREAGKLHAYVELALIDERPGAFVIADHIDLEDPDLSTDSVMANNKWPTGLERETVHAGGLLGRLIEGELPKIVRGFSPEHDIRLEGIVPARCDALAIPVFFNGRITQWALLFTAPDMPIEPEDIRVACAVLNMLSRGAYQLRLQQQVQAMHLEERRKLEEIAALQRTLLPQSLPDRPPLEFAVHYTPSDYAGGDYYDFRTFADGAIGLVIADVAGHGPKAAVVMAMLRSAMFLERSMGLRSDNLVQNMNRFIYEGVSDGVFVTAFFLRIDPATGNCEYANAGHCPPRILRADGTLEVIDQHTTLPLGVLDNIETEGGACTLAPGDAIVLFTDGITEAFNSGHEMYGYDSLDKCLTRLPRPASAQQILDSLVADVNHHCSPQPADDDRCILIVRRRD